METNELLKPRYKVIADYPNSNYRVGEVISFVREVAQSYDECKLSNGQTELFTPGIGWLKKYPHLFKKLEWWEDRQESELPKYVKSLSSSYVYKIKSYDIQNCIALTVNDRQRVLYDMLPATQEEYEQYLNQPHLLTTNKK